ncbi:SCP-2 sterol transfer family protein [Micromonospora pallida]|uniref:SCP-2 sterol transfer family protein n=1 Tax=Micromonospora pallida TaxID=145854 RepID=A0A1C6SE58_9ACTN|nr:SCP-2 sterol transfer family protein [Micromonospora pallida]
MSQEHPVMLPDDITTTLRIDLEHDDGRTTHWFMSIDRGSIRVVEECRAADAVVRTSRQFFDRLVLGRANLFAALVRNEITNDGDVTSLAHLRKMLTGMARMHDPPGINITDGGPG